MSDENYRLSYEELLQYILSLEKMTLDDPVLSNGKIELTPRILLASYTTDKDKDKMLFSLSYNVAKGRNVKECIVMLLKLAAQEGRLKI